MLYSVVEDPPSELVLAPEALEWRSRMLEGRTGWRKCNTDEKSNCSVTWCRECYSIGIEANHDRLHHRNVKTQAVKHKVKSFFNVIDKQIEAASTKVADDDKKAQKAKEEISKKRKEMETPSYGVALDLPELEMPSNALDNKTFVANTPDAFKVKLQFTSTEKQQLDRMYTATLVRLEELLHTDGDPRLPSSMTARFQKDNMARAFAWLAMLGQLDLTKPKRSWEKNGLLKMPAELDLPIAGVKDGNKVSRTGTGVAGCYLVAIPVGNQLVWVRSGKAHDVRTRVMQHLRDVKKKAARTKSLFYRQWWASHESTGKPIEEVVQFHIVAGISSFAELERAACLLYWSTQTRQKLGEQHWPKGQEGNRDWRCRRQSMLEYLLECTYGLIIGTKVKWTESFGYEFPRGGPVIINAAKKQKNY